MSTEELPRLRSDFTSTPERHEHEHEHVLYTTIRYRRNDGLHVYAWEAPPQFIEHRERPEGSGSE